jgi:predicted RND superfamily exporter protein
MINANTAIGFLTLYFTAVVPLQEFGLIACLATMVTYVISIILIPGVFSMLPPPTEASTRHLDGKFVRVFIQGLKYAVDKKRTHIYALTVLLCALSIWGLFKLQAISFMVDDLPEEDKIYTDLRFLESNFKGVMPFEIVVDTKKKGGLNKTNKLRKIEELQEKLETYPEISKTRSVVDIYKTARMAYYYNQPGEYKLPSKAEMSFILEYYRKQKGNKGRKNILNSVVDSSFSKTRISGNIQDIGSVKMKVLLDSIQQDVDRILGKNEPESDFHTIVTGTTKIFIKANEYLVDNLFWSLIATFLLIAAQMFYLFRSWKVMIVSMMANLIPLLIIGGVMGFFHIPLKPSTVLIFGIAFGIAIDNTIHYLAKYRQDRKMGLSVHDSVMLSLDDTGQGIIYTSLILLCGFSIFMASSFGGTIALGVLTSLTLFIAMFSNLLFLPAMVISLNIQENSRLDLIDEYNENDD